MVFDIFNLASRYCAEVNDHPRTGCVIILKSVLFLPVMPVPDQVRDDGSGIPEHNNLKKNWIPGQARNDKTAVCVVLLITTQSRSWWFDFWAIGRKIKSTPVLQKVHLQPGAKHPVCIARNKPV
jgi:hypothetical protein